MAGEQVKQLQKARGLAEKGVSGKGSKKFQSLLKDSSGVEKALGDLDKAIDARDMTKVAKAVKACEAAIAKYDGVIGKAIKGNDLASDEKMWIGTFRTHISRIKDELADAEKANQGGKLEFLAPKEVKDAVKTQKLTKKDADILASSKSMGELGATGKPDKMLQKVQKEMGDAWSDYVQAVHGINSELSKNYTVAQAKKFLMSQLEDANRALQAMQTCVERWQSIQSIGFNDHKMKEEEKKFVAGTLWKMSNILKKRLDDDESLMEKAWRAARGM